jgi:4,4'-diaponeurosporenoate glycosyltransferase
MTHITLALVGWSLGWLLLWRVPRLAATSGSSEPYAVVIPARDEAANIGEIVRQVRAQQSPPAELVVIDDDSSDDTAAIAAAAGATVHSAGPVPPGWVGKTWACHRGATLSHAPVLVFLDADVRIGADALERVVGRVVERGGLVSIAPYHTVPRPHEWLSLFFALIAVMGVGFASMTRRKVSGAFGPCIAIGREQYDRIGGHAAVGDQVVEDMAMARNADDAGLGVEVYGGGAEFTWRMYPSGPASLVEGWTKNIATGARHTPPLRGLAVAIWVSGAIAAVLALTDPSPLALAVFAIWVGQISRMARQIGDFPPVALIGYVVPLFAFVAVFVRSLLLTVFRRRVSWRGRTFRVGTRS